MTMNDERWVAVDAFIAERLLPADRVLEDVLESSRRAGLPVANVSPTEGMLLHLLARAIGAKRVLEIGTLGGYSTVWLARALPPTGSLVSLEINPIHGDVARQNLARAGVGDRVEVRIGPASDSLIDMATADDRFDLVFLDADKASNAEYLPLLLPLTRVGSLIVADNVVRGGAVVNAGSHDPSVIGVRRFFDAVAAEPRLIATAVQTVGEKGYDGFAIALVIADS
jgi:predicted O-methyltransferase YrrM